MQRLLAVFFVSLSGCAMQSQIPIPENHASSYQKELRASHHWDLLAADMAEQTKIALASAGNRILHVSEVGEKTTFNRAFHNLLITQLVQKGITVATNPANAVTVSFDTQVVTHKSERFAYRPGQLTALAAGILVLRNVIPDGNSIERGATFLGLAGAADLAISTYTGPPPKTEIIVTASLSDGARFLGRKTDIYYIQESDVPLFLPDIPAPVPKLKDMRVSGDAR